MSKILDLVNILKNHRVFIQTHDYPDPDAIASAYGMQRLLERFDIESKLVYAGSLNKLSGVRMIDYFNIEIHNADSINDMTEDDYVLIVDAQKYNKNCLDLLGKEVACIDHHPTVIDCDEYLYSDIRMVGACSSIISEYYHDAGIEPTVEEATALLYGIKMDTNDFGRGVAQLDVLMYYQLFPYADQKILEKMQLNSIEFADLKAYGAAINNISVYKNVGFAMIPFDCPDGLIAIISDFLLALDVVELSVVYSVRKNGYKFSVRSEIEALDAGKIVRSSLERLGDGSGGGHSFMAGGFLPIESVIALGNDASQKIQEAFINESFPGEMINYDEFLKV